MAEHNALPPNDEGRPVEVDQGALIHKILARYPGEFTLFRELLQNSDDAHSGAVEIRFETAANLQSTLPDCKPSDIVQWTFKNNGNKFTPQDWTRLSKIAMGNPDPRKVGAFGVGFYSLFSVTDCPIVLSEGDGRKFYWKGSMLYYRNVKPSAEEKSSPWTTFKIPLRKPNAMPEITDFMRFLATSITFMVHLKSVKVFLDGGCIGHISKTQGETEDIDLAIPLSPSSPSGVMTVRQVQRHRFTITAKISTGVRGPMSAEAPESSEGCGIPSASRTSLQSDSSSIFYTTKVDLTVFTANVDAKVKNDLSEELLRSTSKRPPSQLNYRLVYTGKDDYDQSFADHTQPSMSVFQGLRADLDGASHPRIFIGHSTSQTTGIGGHMAAPFIPTVERESIDLVDRSVAVWNSELLYVGGYLARAIYEWELTAIDTLWKERTVSGPPGFQDQLRDRFIHVLKFFTFYDSIPSSKVAQELRGAFYSCSTSPLRLLSSAGVHRASDIRLFDPLRSQFLKYVPMLLPEIANVARRIVDALPAEHKIRTITLSDMQEDLPRHTLDEAELLAYLKWQISHGLNAGMAGLSSVVSFRGANGTIRLSTIKSFIDPRGLGAQIPSEAPVPPFLLPREFASPFSLEQLLRFGWDEFTIADWLQHISQETFRQNHPQYDFVCSAEWAECVLCIISLAWSSSDKIRDLVQSVFGNKKCIPVGRELYHAKETYLPNRDIPAFHHLDLQIVRFPSCREITWEMERFLVVLGVQQHLELRVLKEMVETGKWNTSKLIDYLVQVANTLSDEEIADLTSYRAFAGVNGMGDNSKGSFRANELYPPFDTFRKLHLQLIDLEFKWQDASPEADLMYRLGLRRYPPVDVIVDLCSKGTDVGEHAFDYLCTNLRTLYSDYKCDNFESVAFIPAQNESGRSLEKLGDVFLDHKWKTLGLSVIYHRDREIILEELGVQRYPPSSLLVELLTTKPPPNGEIAREWFEILSDHVSCFTEGELVKLSGARIVPKAIPGQDRVWLTPVQCYLGQSQKEDLYARLFHFVKFGKGDQFLRACHAKNEPSEEDVAECLVENHARFYELAGHERFLLELRDLAVKRTRIPNGTIYKMKVNPVLLGIRCEKTTDADGWRKKPSLREPKDIIIVNDAHTYQLFRDSIVAAPENMPSELEEFYMLLGCRYLTTIVREERIPSNEVTDTTKCSKYRDLIEERLPLFLQYQHQERTLTRPSSESVNVRICEKLHVSKTLLVSGDERSTKTQSVWATAKRDRKGEPIQVWIDSATKEEMYELAASLCRVSFDAVKLNDALLLASILSEELDVLKKRGFEVKQICSPPCPKDPGLAGGTNQRHSNTSTEAASPLPTDPAGRNAVSGADVDSMSPNSTKATSQPPVGDNDAPSCPSTGTMLPTLSKVKSHVGSIMRGIIPSGTAPSAPQVEHQPTSQSHIRSTIEEAIQACRSAPGHYRDNRADITRSLDDGYCNVSATIESLRFLKSIEGVEVHGVLNDDSFMKDMQDQIVHFARIITSVAKIYGLSMNSLRIFYDTTAGCIAFNRQNTIYLNLRYFDAWHYKDVASGDSRQAVSSWFLTLAHEIAHNLIADHNAEHAFWTSAICDAHMVALSRLLYKAGSKQLRGP